ncbi:MAG: sulfotransferase [Gaiellales bacterium]
MGRRLRRGLNRALSLTERAAGGPLPETPLFIVGAPRCGSTLVYQLVVARFDVGYLTNLHCSLNGSPALVERIVGGRTGRHVGFESVHGTVPGRLAPSECGPYWYRFFRTRPQAVAGAEADPQRMARLRRSVAAFGAASGRPLVFKNLINSLRLEPLRQALPEALFVLVTRDQAANARSLLVSRKRRFGTYDAWWSAEPRDIGRLRELPPAAQVVEQVRAVNAAVAHERDRAPERFCQLRYEQVCDDPRGALETVSRFAAGQGCALRPRAEVPARFPPPAGAPLDPAIEAELAAYLETA